MRIQFDHGTPAPLRRHLPEHRVDRSAEKGWEMLENCDMIQRAEEDGYEVIVTTDQSMGYQQNLAGRRLASSFSWPRHGPGFNNGRSKSAPPSRKHVREN